MGMRHARKLAGGNYLVDPAAIQILDVQDTSHR